MEGIEGSSEGTGKHFICIHGTTNTVKRHTDGCSTEDSPPAKKQRLAPAALEGPWVPPSSSTILPEPSQADDEPPGQRSWFSQEECAAELAQMIAFHGYPSSIVEDECFRSLLHGLNPVFQMPSRSAVKLLSHSQAEEAMTQLKQMLASCPGQISLATGIADAGEGRALYMACQFVDGEWAFQRKIMQVFKVVRFPPYNHSAVLGAAEEVCLDVPERVLEQLSLPATSAVLEEAVRQWGLLPDRLFSVAWCQELRDHLRRQVHFLQDHDHLCPEILHAGGEGHFVRENTRISAKSAVVAVVTYTSDVLDSAATLIHKALDGKNEVACLNTLKSLQLSHEERTRRFSELGLNHVGRYDKRWYSYYCALELLHKEHSEHNPALVVLEEEEEERPDFISESQITQMLSEIRVSRDGRVVTNNKKPSSSRHKESLFTDLLRKIFGTIYRAIEAVSSPGCATASLCLGEVKKVRDVVESEAMDACRNVPKAIAYAQGGFAAGEDANVVLLEAQGKLDKFLEDSYVYLSIPTVLDPRFKLEGVRSVFSEVFDDESVALANFSKVGKKIEDMFSDYSEDGRTGGARAAAMDVDSTAPQQSTTAMDELERYLEDGVVVHGDGAGGEEAGGFDVLQWWKENEVRYSTVARMARDALAMPTSDLLSPKHLSCVRSMARSS